VRNLATASSVSALVGLLLLGPLVLLFGLNGALVHITLFAVVGYVVSLWARRRASRQAGVTITLLARPSLSATRALLSYGSANAVTRIVETASLLVVRTQIVHTLGVAQNGIYQVIFSIPAQFLTVIIGALSSYSFPLISGLQDREEITAAINTALRFTLLATTPLLAALLLFGRPVIVAFYSREFLPAADFMPVELLGDFFKMISWALGLSLLGRGHLVAFAILEVGWSAVFTAGVVSEVAQLGLWCAVGSYLLAHVLQAGATYAYQRRFEGFRLTAANARLLVCSCLLTLGAAVGAASGQWAYQLLYTAVALVAWLLLGTESVERTAAWSSAKSRLKLAVSLRGASAS
jgi:PST family polysaccharide transporter